MSPSDIAGYVQIAGIVVALASAIASMTPNKSDNKIVDNMAKVLDVFALNWGSRNPRTIQKDAEEGAARKLRR